jgi:hypothetical protein
VFIQLSGLLIGTTLISQVRVSREKCNRTFRFALFFVAIVAMCPLETSNQVITLRMTSLIWKGVG